MYVHNAVISTKTFIQPTSKILVYALLCPETFAVKYVGKTSQGFERIRQHYYDRRKRKGEKFSRKSLWVRELYSKGLVFKVCYLEYFSNEEELNLGEIKWIKLFTDLGEKLLNHTEGGEVTYRPKYSAEERAAISKRTKEAMARPEVRQRLRETHIGKPNPNKGKSFGPEFRAKIAEANLRHSTKVWTSKGEYFPSIQHAATAYNATHSSMSYTVHSGKSRDGVYFYKHNPKGEK